MKTKIVDGKTMYQVPRTAIWCSSRSKALAQTAKLNSMLQSASIEAGRE